MVSKRCYAQEFRLRPSELVNWHIEYALGHCAAKCNVDLHEFNVQPNHPHVALTDREGTRPKFFQLFHSLVARAINKLFGDTDSLFSRQPYNDPISLGPEKTLEWSLYILNNGVKHGLVRYPWDWPGVTSWRMEYDEPKVIKRPPGFFSENMPEEVELIIRRPPGVRRDLGDRQLRRWIREQARLRAGDLAAQLRAAGRRFKGVRQILRQPRHNGPAHRKMRDGIAPRVAGGDQNARRAELKAFAKFYVEHEDARQRRKGGDFTATFPYGTYLAKVRDGAPCHGPAP